MKYLLPFLLVATFGTDASAALIMYCRMDSLAFLATDIVLCDEVKYEKKPEPGFSGHTYYLATFTVVQVLKGGACEPKQQLSFELDGIYTRHHMSSYGRTDKPPEIPMGRALLFLTKNEEKWRPVLGGVKLIIKGETHCYGQFISNPGGLWLARMAPENIDVPEATPYGEELLLKDLRAAMERAKGMTKATGVFAKDEVIRKTPKSK